LPQSSSEKLSEAPQKKGQKKRKVKWGSTVGQNSSRVPLMSPHKAL